ncbi:cobalt-precorrin-6A reductase [Pelagibacterium montanilacus]|uniref:cobalt-precorrin-6A reductase n=1 Tax=Pelagibacterium montanilacus TaxID=2185280 RepID=UPI000F8C39DA|nr:cobalt-precorrin-6A reductase [Pelagibacterium montanilacus]
MTKGNVQDLCAGARVLILGGTSLARALATLLGREGYAVTTSLAGRTRDPLLPDGAVRIGGFGGARGLADYLVAHRVDVLVDATHPFAARMSANAHEAARATGTPVARLAPAPWPVDPDWMMVPDMASAARSLPPGARVLLTIGRQEIGAFVARTDCSFVARMIEQPEMPLPGWTLVLGRGPFATDTEQALAEAHAITHLVTKNAGGPWPAKLEMARAQRLAVIVVQRPQLPDVETVGTPQALLEWLAGLAPYSRK